MWSCWINCSFSWFFLYTFCKISPIHCRGQLLRKIFCNLVVLFSKNSILLQLRNWNIKRARSLKVRPIMWSVIVIQNSFNRFFYLTFVLTSRFVAEGLVWSRGLRSHPEGRLNTIMMRVSDWNGPHILRYKQSFPGFRFTLRSNPRYPADLSCHWIILFLPETLS